MPEPLRAVLSAAYAPLALFDAPTPPHGKGKRPPHVWAQWGNDEKYERCAVCGALREVKVRQGGLF